MTIEEYQEENLSLKEQLKDFETSKENNKKLEQRILELQEHNQKLYLKVTNQKAFTEEEEEEEEFTLNDLLSSIKGGN